jgi:hypothetical protein
VALSRERIAGRQDGELAWLCDLYGMTGGGRGIRTPKPVGGGFQDRWITRLS